MPDIIDLDDDMVERVEAYLAQDPKKLWVLLISTEDELLVNAYTHETPALKAALAYLNIQLDKTNPSNEEMVEVLNEALSGWDWWDLRELEVYHDEHIAKVPA